MSAQKGKLLLISVNTTGDTYVDLVEARSNDLTINGSTVEITNKGSAGWKELLEGAGITSMSLSASGVFTDSAAYQKVLAASLANTHLTLRIVRGIGDEFNGIFAVTSLKASGEFNGEEAFSFSFESAGVVAYTPSEDPSGG